MKYLKLLFLASCLAIFPLCGAMTCTPSQQTITVNTLSTVGNTVDSAVKAYLDLVVKGQIPTSSLATVTKAYNDFQSVFNIAVGAAQMNTATVATPAVTDSANAVIAAITKAKGTQ